MKTRVAQERRHGSTYSILLNDCGIARQECVNSEVRGYGISNTPESDMARRRVFCHRHSRSHPVAGAVSRMAEERTTPHDAFGDMVFHGVKRNSRPPWIQNNLTGTTCESVRVVPIAAQFPHVAPQVVDSEAVCWVRHDWSRLDVAIQFGVGYGECPSQMLHFTSPCLELRAPRKPDLFPTSSGCKLPLASVGKRAPLHVA